MGGGGGGGGVCERNRREIKEEETPVLFFAPDMHESRYGDGGKFKAVQSNHRGSKVTLIGQQVCIDA